MRDSKILGCDVDCAQRETDDDGGARRVASVPSARRTPQTMMNDSRDDVERALDLYVRLDMFRIGSNMGRLVVHESRAELRKRHPELYRPPTAPVMRLANGEKMRRVAPAKDVTHVVKVKSDFHGSNVAATDQRTQLWKSTIDTKLARIARSCVFCAPSSNSKCKHVPMLLDAARLRVEIEYVRSIGAQAERNLSSRTRRKRMGEHGVSEASAQRNSAKDLSHELVGRRIKITRSTLYEEAVDLFNLVCSENAEVRAYCFPERHAA